MTDTNLIPFNEEERIENLKKYKILYTKSEPIFDQLAAIAATTLNAPLAMINFVDRAKVWTKANQNGDSGMEHDRQVSLCSLAILNDKVTVFEDLEKEFPRVVNPMTAGEYGFRFYAAAPIITNEGFNVGSVCVVDKTSRSFSEEDQRKLERVANMVTNEMNKRVTKRSPLIKKLGVLV
ncbi:MAG: GAF domain-containing protein [Pedobacter sp.]|nr:MAG: GAF domain-containing protein [Pedobacter sp.]